MYSRAYANICCVMASVSPFSAFNYTLAHFVLLFPVHQIHVTKEGGSSFNFRRELLSLCKREFDKVSRKYASF